MAGQGWVSNVLAKFDPWGVVEVVDVAPRTEFVFLHHYGDVFPRYPPFRVGMPWRMIVLGFGEVAVQGVHYEES